MMSSNNPRKKFFKPPKPIDEMSEKELEELSRFIFRSIMEDDEEAHDESR